jgi:hypothetical protein
MEKSKIIIVSSGKTLPLAAMLTDALQTDFCEARLWSRPVSGQAGDTDIRMLKNTVEGFDFAVIVAAQADMIVAATGDTLKTLAQCVFDAGFLVAALGPERCFLVHSAKPSDLPSDFGEIMAIPFEEPADLSDRRACAQAFAPVAAVLKKMMQSKGRAPFHASVPLLSFAELFQRERPLLEGGDLREGQVIVCDTQPLAGVQYALQVYQNMKSGISYRYFLLFTDDSLDRVFQSLQVMSVAGAGGAGSATDFLARVGIIKKESARVLEVLRDMCSSGSLRGTFFAFDPQVCFRVHNANDQELARYYARYFECGYALWAAGPSAWSLSHILPLYLEEDKMDRILIRLKQGDAQVDKKNEFDRSLTRGLHRYFPGIEDEVRQLCVGGAA